MFDHPKPARRHIEHLPHPDPDTDGIIQTGSTATAPVRPVLDNLVRIRNLPQRRSRRTGCLPGRRPDLERNDFSGGLARPSDDGGFDEFRELSPNRPSNSATRAACSAICAACATTSAANSSYDGADDPSDEDGENDPDTTQIIHAHHYNHSDRHAPPEQLPIR